MSSVPPNYRKPGSGSSTSSSSSQATTEELGATRLSYDAGGNLVQVVSPSETKTLSYDGAGNLIQVAGNITKTLEYDGSGNLTTITKS